jgi:BUD22
MTSSTKDPNRRSDGNEIEKERQRGKLKRPREDNRSTDRQAYYDRLLHQCHKDLHKHAKVTKTFETQKLIRRIKELKRDEKNAVVNQEFKLHQLKAYSLEPVVAEAIRRLGLLQLDPKSHQNVLTASDAGTDQCSDQERTKPSDLAMEADPSIKSGKGNTATSNGTNDDNSIGAWILARILQHKSMCAAMERWNEQITEYRRWSLRQQERMDGVVDLEWSNKKTKAKKNNPAISDPLAIGGSLFVTLGSSSNELRSGEEDAASSSDPLGYYGPGGETSAKKNRQGQRGRRAKAAALAAKQQGRTLSESLNWRQSKRERAVDDAPERLEQSRIHRQKGKPEQHAERHDPSATSSSSVLSESLHPSWQARKEQKAAIVAFQGTKIKFSND